MKSQRIATRGMGGFLNPPGHPEHTRSVEYDKRRGEYQSACSLTVAVSAEFIEPHIRGEARYLLTTWNPGPSPDPAWVLQVLGYFRGCYRNPLVEHQWDADSMIIDQTLDPLSHLDDHAGVNHIRKFYPGFIPTAQQFREAKWGT